MKTLDSYMKLQKEIFEYFGYKEDWVKIPISDRREMYWMLDQNKNGGGDVTYHEESLTVHNVEGGKIYTDEIYTQRFLPKWVYRGEDYTMICTNPHTDGNKFLCVFDNNKEQVDQELQDAKARWDKGCADEQKRVEDAWNKNRK